VISNGLVLDKDGNKMSKRLGNAVNPFEAIEKYGSDPLRWYMIANSSPWDNLKFDAAGVQEMARKLFSTVYNTYSFFALYANVDGFDNSAPQVPFVKRPEIDRWILSLLNSLILEVDSDLEDYEPTKAARAIGEFVGDNLSNWYVRLNRKRFWGTDMTEDKLSAYQTLYQCLETLALLMAPIAPFYADKLYRDLTEVTTGEAQPVHLAKFPEADKSLIDSALEERMKLAQTITSMVLALRRKVNIKVRQPLSSIMIPVNSAEQRAMLEAIRNLVLNEVNIKEMKIVDSSEGIFAKRVKPDFKKLGPKFGKQMKAVAAAVAAMSSAQIAEIENNGAVNLDIDGQNASIELSDVEIISEDIPGWLVANEGSVTIAIDVTVTPELKMEGIARDIVNRIQNIRKSRGYEITDRINICFAPSEEADEAITRFKDYIGTQVLASSIEIAPLASEENVETLDIDGLVLNVRIEK
jgi:isoleucyl-tRNA synthetase